jgi:hypothetical protein
MSGSLGGCFCEEKYNDNFDGKENSKKRKGRRGKEERKGEKSRQRKKEEGIIYVSAFAQSGLQPATGVQQASLFLKGLFINAQIK